MLFGAFPAGHYALPLTKVKRMKVETRDVAKKLIAIAIAQALTGCAVDPSQYDRLTEADREQLAALLDTDFFNDAK